jgi:hypothetical protein
VTTFIAHAGHSHAGPSEHGAITGFVPSYAAIIAVLAVTLLYLVRKGSQQRPAGTRRPQQPAATTNRHLLSALIAVVGLAAAGQAQTLLASRASMAAAQLGAVAAITIAATCSALIAGRRPAVLAGVVATVVYVAIHRAALPDRPQEALPVMALAAAGLLMVCQPPERSRLHRLTQVLAILLTLPIAVLLGQAYRAGEHGFQQVALAWSVLALVGTAAVLPSMLMTRMTEPNGAGTRPTRRQSAAQP